VATERPPEHEESEREQRRLERLIPEIMRRALEAGYEKLNTENVRQLVSDLKLPKEALSVLLGQLDETKNGLYRAVAKEVRDFLDHTNFAEEITKALTALSFEIKTEVRFIPNDARARPTPDIKTRVAVRRDRHSQPPAESPATPTETPHGGAPDTQEKTD